MCVGGWWAYLAREHMRVHVYSAALIVLPPGVLEGVKKQSHYCVSIDVREKKELVMEMHTLLQRISSYWRKNGYIGWDNGTHFMTMIPCFVAASRSMLSTPVPARPIILRRDPAAMTSAVTFVAERTIRPSYSWTNHTMDKRRVDVYTQRQ